MNKGWILDVNVKRLGRTEETRKGSEKELLMRLEERYEWEWRPGNEGKYVYQTEG